VQLDSKLKENKMRSEKSQSLDKEIDKIKKN